VDEKVASGLSPYARDNWTPAAGLVLWSNERPSDILSGVPGAEPFHFLLSPFPLPPEDRKQQDVGCGMWVWPVVRMFALPLMRDYIRCPGGLLPAVIGRTPGWPGCTFKINSILTMLSRLAAP